MDIYFCTVDLGDLSRRVDYYRSVYRWLHGDHLVTFLEGLISIGNDAFVVAYARVVTFP